MGEVLRPFQDITYLLTVFISVFLANLGIETVKSITGRPMINLKQCYYLLQLKTIIKGQKTFGKFSYFQMPEITDTDLRTIRCAASLLVAVTSAGGPVIFRELKIHRFQENGHPLSPIPPAWLSATLLIIASVYSWLTTIMLAGFAGAVIWMF